MGFWLLVGRRINGRIILTGVDYCGSAMTGHAVGDPCPWVAKHRIVPQIYPDSLYHLDSGFFPCGHLP